MQTVRKGGLDMDEKTRVLICIGAATAANCISCFEYYFGKAEAVGLKTDEIEEAVDLASQVKKGAHMAFRNSIRGKVGGEKEYPLPCNRQMDSSCCG
jgi:alkylhydroperoxidase/carboxymuconolactone decarboxylase family protein YurZ